jgi:predicted DNA-binding protein with PD1-like motif
MQYLKGHIGRVFLLKFKDGDIFLKELNKFAKKERLSAATIVFLGALKEGNLVTGPKKTKMPPKPNWTKFKAGQEVLGIGTIFTNKEGPEIHIHTAMGKKTKTLVGCLRKEPEVFLCLEAVVFELKGIRATKEFDPKVGISLLNII